MRVLRAARPSLDGQQLAVLPSAFGTLYQGEHFHALTTTTTNTTTTFLLEQPHHQQPTALTPDEHHHITHHTTQPGPHALICTPTASHRKLYKFSVHNPLAITAKLHSHALQPTQADLPPSTTTTSSPRHLQIQLHNLADKPLLALHLSTLPRPAAPIGAPSASLQPGDTHQFLFALPADEEALPTEVEVRWTSLMGEPGVLTRPILPPATLLHRPPTAQRNALFESRLAPTGPPARPGEPVVYELRLACVAQQDPQADAALLAILHTQLAALHLRDTAALHLLPLAPQPLQPQQQTPPPAAQPLQPQQTPPQRTFILPLLPTHPNPAPLTLANLATGTPHIDSLFGFGPPHAPPARARRLPSREISPVTLPPDCADQM